MSDLADEFEDETVGEDLLPLLHGRFAAEVAAALVGCGYYRTDPDKIAHILRCDADSGRVTLQDEGRERVGALAGAYVLHDDSRRRIFDAALSPEQRVAREETALLAAFGYNGRVDHADLHPLAEAIRQARAGPVTANDRQRALALAQRYDALKLVERFCRQWIAHLDSTIPGDILIPLVKILRDTGRTAEALGKTDILLDRDSHLTTNERQILFVQRAALWMDRFEQVYDRKLLARARRSADRAWALVQSDACSFVYQRLRKLENSFDEDRSS